MTLTTNLPLITKHPPFSKVNRSPALDDGGESKEEGESEEGEDFSDSSEYFESYEIIDMDYKYEDGEEFSPQDHRVSRPFHDSDCSVHDGHGPLHE